MGWWGGRVAGLVGFVGRELELSRLRTAPGAGTRMLLVVGDAGAGKTRFVGEGMRRAAAGGLVSVWGGCLPLAEKLPLLPVVDALGELSRIGPFFTEQLVAASLAGPGGGLRAPAGLPERLAELLGARAGRCGGDGRAVLAALAVAGRPLTEVLLRGVTGLDAEAVRAGLRELAAARLLADSAPGAACRARHALLAEAVAAGLLPGERVVLHERTARALQAVGDETLAAEVAGHWAAAGRGAEELSARAAAAGAAERVFGYAEAAAHWQRAIELRQELPAAAATADVDLPRLYLRAIDALEISGDGERAGVFAEEAYRRFAGHPDRATAAVIHERAAVFRAIDAPAAGLPLIREALRLFGQAPPSADHAEAWLRYATVFLLRAEGRQEPTGTALNRALEIAEAAGATALISRILSWLAVDALVRGQVQEGFAFLDRGRALAEAAGDGEAALRLAVTESDALLKAGKFQRAADVARRGLRAARQAGRQASLDASVLAANAAEALLARGRTAEAAALIDPLTTGPPGRDHQVAHTLRVEIDMLRGDLEAAARRQQQINALLSHIGDIEHAREAMQRAAELALWAGRPGDALREVRRALALFTAPDLTILFGRLLAAGMRACADLAGQARAQRDGYAARDALAAADDLASWVERMAGAPFTDHPSVAAIPADRATWDAERTRLAGAGDPAAWRAAAKTWEDLGCPHRAGYAWWRHAEAQLTAGQPAAAAATALQTAATAAEGHAPLLAKISTLAQRARIPLQTAPAEILSPPEAPAPYGLTKRELAVLGLLAAGRTNAQIGAELYISPKTASVHVTGILRKLGVSNRVQAAALAERAGLLQGQQT
jgi:DNA-binding CsgD family transcriptional regulator